MTEEETARLAAERPCEAALAEVLSKTWTEEEFRHQRDTAARRAEMVAALRESVSRREGKLSELRETCSRRERKIASLEKALENQRRENRRIRSSRSYRLGNALLAVPRFLAGRWTAARKKD
ncbi:MAG: hypothetical protein IJS32_01090 [Kiritimatiellae bacterium]|nr:hypothetical protein [Kiritimatiellia bacterium]